MTLDTFSRPLKDLRISVTDRCNFRCVYCMPKEVFGSDYNYLARSEMLSYEEIVRFVRLLVNLGITKVRITGGEPLLRKDIDHLIKMLALIPDLDLTLTTNGALLTEDKCLALKTAGLQRITISLDSLNNDTFSSLNDVDFSVDEVINGIDNAASAGLTPIKINMVVMRSVNLESIVPMAKYFRDSGHILRFIEYMDVGDSNGWKLDEVVPSSEIVEIIGSQLPIEPIAPNYLGEVASRWQYTDGSGEIGLISSVSQPFCGDCSRLRLSARGELFTCLFASSGYDVRALLRGDTPDEKIVDTVASLWRNRDDRYSELRSEQTQQISRVEMSYIGG
ncbi:MAG: GTP 3',8-cyclase MoaA [Anaerolineaceae bacterium]|nr:GTP 3',8-cyclase MoaA [Anaerolineaceae bacterium]